MAGRAGRRGIDTIGHVVHCNNLFDLPTQSDYVTMLGGKPQSLVSKFRISYSLVLNLLKNGKYAMSDYIAFVRNSMVSDELNGSIELQEQRIVKIMAACDELRKLQVNLKTPMDICNRYTEISELLPMSVNKKRRQLEKEQNAIIKEYIHCKADSSYTKRILDFENELRSEKDEQEYLENYIENNLRNVCKILIENGFVNIEDDMYSLTDLGKIAANIAEIHPLVTSQLITKWGWFRKFSVEQIIGLFSCFTDVNIPSDIRRNVPYSEDGYMRIFVTELDQLFHQYDEMEEQARIYTGIQYEDAVAYDMPDLAIQWCNCETEMECKIFIQNNVADKGISVGDFTKALLKISTIARELSVVAESSSKLECLHKLTQIDNKILKYVTTAQSLYV